MENGAYALLEQMLHFPLYIQGKEEGKDQESIQSSNTPDRPRAPYRKVTKTQQNVKYRKAKRPAISQQETTKLQETQTRQYTNKK